MDIYLLIVIIVLFITLGYTLIADRGMFLCIILIAVILLYVVNLIRSNISTVTNYVDIVKSEVNTVLQTVDVVVDNLKNIGLIGKNLNFNNPLQKMPGVPSVPSVSSPNVSSSSIPTTSMSSSVATQPSSSTGGPVASSSPGFSSSPSVPSIGSNYR